MEPCLFFLLFIFLLLFLKPASGRPFALISLVNKKVGKFCAYIVLSVFLIFFVTDSFVYQQFRLHLNIAMLQMTLLGGGQVVSFSGSMILQICLLMGACFIAALVCFWLANVLSNTQPASSLLIFLLLLSSACLSAKACTDSALPTITRTPQKLRRTYL